MNPWTNLSQILIVELGRTISSYLHRLDYYKENFVLRQSWVLKLVKDIVAPFQNTHNIIPIYYNLRSKLSTKTKYKLAGAAF